MKIKNNQRDTISYKGIKGLLILLILFYHLFQKFLPGGYIGFPMFIALMGYECMDNYININTRSGPFLIRVFKILWPSLIMMVTTLALVIAIVNWDFFPLIRTELISGLTFLQNYFQAFKLETYFSHRLSLPFSHLFFVSIIMQISFLWFILLIGKRTKQKIVNIAFISLVASFLSLLYSIALLFLLKEEGDYLLRLEVYLFPFSLGVLSALASNRLKTQIKSENRDMIIGFLSILLIVLVFSLKGTLQIKVLGVVLSSILFAFLLLLVKDNKTIFSTVFKNNFLIFLGERSYFYYLWQYPILFSLRELRVEEKIGYVSFVILSFAILFILGEFAIRLAKGMKSRKKKVIILSILLIIGFLTLYSFYTQENIELKKAEKPISNKVIRKKDGEEKKDLNNIEKEVFRPTNEVAVSLEQINARFPQYRLTTQDLKKLQSQAGKIVGDETTSLYQEEYTKLMPRIQYDGENDRQLYQVIETVENTAENMGNTNTPIILQFGFKADFNIETLEEAIELADGQRIILINIVTKDPWEDSVNNKLKKVSEKYDNVFLLDWHAVAKEQEDFFDQDTGLIKPSGQRLLTQMLAHRILSTNVNEKIDSGEITR